MVAPSRPPLLDSILLRRVARRKCSNVICNHGGRAFGVFEESNLLQGAKECAKCNRNRIGREPLGKR